MTQNRTFLSPIVMLGAAPKGRRQCPMRTAGEPDSRQLRRGTRHNGRPVLVGLDSGASESTDAWKAFLDAMVARGLRPPLLVVSDGAPGLLAAVELVLAHSLHQRCLIHRARNVLAKVPVEHQGQVKVAFWTIFDDITAPPGEQAIAVARTRATEFAKTYQRRFPGAVDCLMSNFESLTTYLRFPAGHWSRIRHSNFIERTFGETRRRVKVIGRLPGERSCLGLVWAVLDRASRGWRGVVMTPAAVRHLQELRRQLITTHANKEEIIEANHTITPAA